MPPASSPPTLTPRSPETVPATPVGRIIKAPMPLVRLAPSPLMSTATVTLAIAIRVRLAKDSKKKSPASTALAPRPSRLSSAPRTATRTNGPAGKVRVSNPSPSEKSRVTATGLVLISIRTSSLESEIPGTVRAIPPTVRIPETPVEVISKSPAAPVMETKVSTSVPRVRETSEKVASMVPEASCLKSKLPLRR